MGAARRLGPDSRWLAVGASASRQPEVFLSLPRRRCWESTVSLGLVGVVESGPAVVVEPVLAGLLQAVLAGLSDGFSVSVVPALDPSRPLATGCRFVPSRQPAHPRQDAWPETARWDAWIPPSHGPPLRLLAGPHAWQVTHSMDGGVVCNRLLRAALLARARIVDGVVLGFLGGIIVLLLGYALTTNNDRHDRTSDRITGLEDTVNTRFDVVDAEFAQVDAEFAQVDAKIDAKFAAQDAKIDARFGRLEDAVGEINVKLAALIAHLDKTEEVEAAVEGRFEDTAGPQGAVG